MKKIDLLENNNYEYAVPKETPKKGKNVTINIIVMFITVILLCIFLFYFKRYTDRDAIDTLESKINASVNTAISVVSEETFQDDYLIVDFPDSSIATDGYFVTDNGSYEEFINGYIIVYKDKSVAFKVSDGTYCASKSFDNTAYKLYIFGECTNYDIEYKEVG